MKAKVGLIQMPVVPDKQRNLQTAAARIGQLARQGADLVLLPEMFCCPYHADYFRAYSEEAGGPAWTALSRAAGENGVYLIGGSLPEREGAALYNTCFVFGRKGEPLTRHRKVHLFDVSIQGGQQFRESDTFTPGDDITVFSTEFGVMGVAVCFDLRFPELFRLTALAGAQAVFVPAAFNLTTGPLHWELNVRSRAADNQLFLFAAAPARDESSPYVSYGHSIGASPWGARIATLGEGDETLLLEIDLSETASVREQLPLLRSLREDVYPLRRPRC